MPEEIDIETGTDYRDEVVHDGAAASRLAPQGSWFVLLLRFLSIRVDISIVILLDLYPSFFALQRSRWINYGFERYFIALYCAKRRPADFAIFLFQT